jgi:hypothetical protein
MLHRPKFFRVHYWTQGRVVLKHLILSITLVLLTYISYTAFRRSLPTPDVLSPYAYLLAFIACLIAYLRGADRKNAKPDLWVLVLCGLAFLDEISYGVEPGIVNAIYVEKYNVYIYDLHNLIGLAVELVRIFLQENNWNGALFVSHLKADISAIVLSIAFIATLRVKTTAKNLANKVPSTLATFILIAGIGTLITLAHLPADPKNAWLLNYSRARVVMMTGVFILSALPLLFLSISNRKIVWAQELRERLVKSNRYLDVIKYGAILLILLGITYQFSTPFITYPDQKVIVGRITPITVWLIASSLLVVTAIQALRGKLTKPISAYLDPIRNFFRTNPSVIYALMAVLLVIVAQVNDKEWLLIGDYFSISNIDIADWGWWTEEVFEFTAAVEFFVASFFYKKNG